VHGAVVRVCVCVCVGGGGLADDPDDDEVLYVHRTAVPAEDV
jgi:hypothetical protein